MNLPVLLHFSKLFGYSGHNKFFRHTYCFVTCFLISLMDQQAYESPAGLHNWVNISLLTLQPPCEGDLDCSGLAVLVQDKAVKERMWWDESGPLNRRLKSTSHLSTHFTAFLPLSSSPCRVGVWVVMIPSGSTSSQCTNSPLVLLSLLSLSYHFLSMIHGQMVQEGGSLSWQVWLSDLHPVASLVSCTCPWWTY